MNWNGTIYNGSVNTSTVVQATQDNNILTVVVFVLICIGVILLGVYTGWRMYKG